MKFKNWQRNSFVNFLMLTCFSFFGIQAALALPKKLFELDPLATGCEVALSFDASELNGKTIPNKTIPIVTSFSKDLFFRKDALASPHLAVPFIRQKITESNAEIVDELEVYDPTSKKLLVNSKILETEANSYLLSKNLGTAEHIDAAHALLIDHEHLYFFVLTNQRAHILLRYHLGTKSILKLWQSTKVLNYFPSISIQHGGNLIDIMPHWYDCVRDEYQHYLIDMRTGEQHYFTNLEDRPVIFSASGKSYFWYKKTEIKRGVYKFQNTVVDSKLKKKITFEGQVLTQSADLKNFIIDRSVKPSYEIDINGTTKDFKLPELYYTQILENGKVESRELPGWSGIKEKIKTASLNQLELKGMDSELIGPQNHLVINFKFKSEIEISLGNSFSTGYNYTQNLAAYWNLNKQTNPTTVASTEFDTANDKEPSLTYQVETSSSRKFATRITQDEKLVLVRANGGWDDNSSYIVVKVITVDLRTGEQQIAEYETNLLDDSNNYSNRRGVSGLQISVDGKTIALEMWGHPPSLIYLE